MDQDELLWSSGEIGALIFGYTMAIYSYDMCNWISAISARSAALRLCDEAI